MKTPINQNHPRFIAIKRRLAAKCFIYGLNLIFLVFPSDSPGAQVDSSTDDCAIGTGSYADSEFIRQRDSKNLLDAANIKILSWNIKKGQEARWDQDLRELSSDKHLVFLQEAKLTQNFYDALGKSKFRAVGRGWKTSGVLTAAAVQQISRCTFRSTEPILRTPKATLLSEYGLRDSNLTLLAVNVHMVNFSLNTVEFETQLSNIRNVIGRHTGPVILSGDFNTWRSRRMELLESVVEELAMSRITFNEDNRTRTFGYPLDHIFTRGMRMVSSKINVVHSSDHNALSVELTVDKDSTYDLKSLRSVPLVKVESGKSRSMINELYVFGGGAI